MAYASFINFGTVGNGAVLVLYQLPGGNQSRRRSGGPSVWGRHPADGAARGVGAAADAYGGIIYFTLILQLFKGRFQNVNFCSPEKR